MSQFEVITITLSFVLGLSMSHLLWLPTAYRIDRATFEAGNYANIALAVFAVIGFTTRRISIQWVSATAFGLVVVWASVFVWTGGSL